MSRRKSLRIGVPGPSPNTPIPGKPATLGGGIYINAFARGQRISNNRLINNQGTLGGGIRCW